MTTTSSATTAGTANAGANHDPLLTIEQTAEYLDAGATFVRSEIKRGRLVGTRLGRHLRVRRSAIETYLRSAAITPTE